MAIWVVLLQYYSFQKALMAQGELLNQNHVFDVPGPSPSSVGCLRHPPEDTMDKSMRLKGMVLEVMDSAKTIANFLDEFSRLSFIQGATRITERIIVNRSALAELTEAQREQFNILHEGAILLENCGIEDLDDCAIIYVGRNKEERTPAQTTIQDELRRISQASLNGSPCQIKQLDATYNVRILDHTARQDANIQQQYAALYSAFGYSTEDVIRMLTSSNNILVAVFDGDTIASTAMAENVSLPIRRNGTTHTLNLAEITEGITNSNGSYRGKGLYTHAATTLMRYITNSTQVHTVYAESNCDNSIGDEFPDRADWIPPVIVSAHRQGRLTGLYASQQLGLSPSVLKQHVHIRNGPSDHRPNTLFNDLMVTYINRFGTNGFQTRYGTN